MAQTLFKLVLKLLELKLTLQSSRTLVLLVLEARVLLALLLPLRVLRRLVLLVLVVRFVVPMVVFRLVLDSRPGEFELVTQGCWMYGGHCDAMIPLCHEL